VSRICQLGGFFFCAAEKVSKKVKGQGRQSKKPEEGGGEFFPLLRGLRRGTTVLGWQPKKKAARTHGEEGRRIKNFRAQKKASYKNEYGTGERGKKKKTVNSWKKRGVGGELIVLNRYTLAEELESPEYFG